MKNIESLLSLPSSWQNQLDREEITPDLNEPVEKVKAKIDQNISIYPPLKDIYNAFKFCNFNNTKIVIFGQDPYHQKDTANGLAFAVNAGHKIPPSLRNIYKEIQNDIGIVKYDSGDLHEWAAQGVLLLNSSLTVEDSSPGSHEKIGWDNLIFSIIKLLNKKGNVVFMLWGANSINKKKLIDESTNYVLTAPHPSPLSSYRGFFGCKHFSKANNFLETKKIKPILW